MAPGFSNGTITPLLSAKQFLRVPIRRGDDCLTRAERDGESSGNNLRFLSVWCNVDVRRANMLNKFFRAHKAVHEDQIR